MAGDPQHHGRPMYRDEHEGRDMRRWLCTEPDCAAVIPASGLAKLHEMAWALENGIQLPDVTIIGGSDE